MSQYDKIDALIVDSIKGRCHSFASIFSGRSLFDEAMRISHVIGREPDCIVDSRLQALRRRGVIMYVIGWSWQLKEAK